ncbi:hypothetical protein HN832_04710 [archaeon]|jgi:DNA-directed RNA polymerase subunit M/transcription elongation factor TFIIS|nr:hypothetical protein [archaeon]MBT4373990.1 hypothetical protein [archaeon]MBT4532086.1 hypothetical protein [archaeon]MBT7001976.1 hypothetical protein [archaeon]MBT7282687.1 hypothetical protein [archaeon]
MKFCDKCGKPLLIENEIAKCSCGYQEKATPLNSKEKIQEPIQKGKGVAKDLEIDQGFPHLCKKCGHEFAEVTDLGVFWSDESSVYLFKCKKCHNTEREAYGSSNM